MSLLSFVESSRSSGRGALIAAACLLGIPPVLADEPANEKVVRLDEVTVAGQSFQEIPLASGTVSVNGLARLHDASSISAYDAVAALPSVYREASDAFGLAEMNQHPAIKIRGKSSSGPVALRNFEGVPMQGTPGGGDHFVDMENIATATLYKGVFAPQSGLGFTNLIGKIDLSFDRAHAEPGLSTTQSFGSENFYRGFVRADSGDHGGLRAFLSGSVAEADKFKGSGDYTRDNYTVGLAAGKPTGFSAEAYAIYNDYTQYDYRYLSYAQATDLGTYGSYDFSDNPKDSYYYGYNRQRFEDTAVMAVLRYRWNEKNAVTLKPYYWRDEGYYLSAAQTGMIRDWLIDHDLYGMVAEWTYSSGPFDSIAGLLLHRQQRPGSPTAWKMYAVASGAPVFKKWGLLSNESYHELISPYATANYQLGNLRVSAGARYSDTKIGSQLSYSTTAGDVSYDEAMALATLDARASVGSIHFHHLLPYAAADYRLSSLVGAYCGYNRTVGFDINLYPTYISNKANFLVPLSEIFRREKMEVSDNFDMGLRLTGESWALKPGVYYTSVRNKQISLYDPAIVVSGATYPTNAADAHSAGAELEWSQTLLPQLTLTAAGSYNLFEYDEDLAVLDKDGHATTADGHQVVDVPKLLANVSLAYRLGDLTFTPTWRYVGSRFADSANSQEFGGRGLFDVRLAYAFAVPAWRLHAVELALSVTNVFDREYIGAINGSDYFYGGASGQATFLVGAPRSFVGTVSVKF